MKQQYPMTIGIVIGGAHSIYTVATEQGAFLCSISGVLKQSFAASSNVIQQKYQRKTLKQTPIRLSIGDHVEVGIINQTTGIIERILPRDNQLSRTDADIDAKTPQEQLILANVQQAVLIFAVASPEPHIGMIDRYLAICEHAQIHALLCFTKCDLPHTANIKDIQAIYTELGYKVIQTSVNTGEGITSLQAYLKSSVSIFLGASGVGKSSLLNALETGLAVRTGSVNNVTKKGKHTTTGTQLYPLQNGGWIADSAGIRALTAWNIPDQELAHCFVEFRAYFGKCLYRNCKHHKDDGCAIKYAIEQGILSKRRYQSYIGMLQNTGR
jgi:ribosome biogenesis GTPase